jgi:hypothetical protein
MKYPHRIGIRVLRVTLLQRCDPHEGGSFLAKPWAIGRHVFESPLQVVAGSGLGYGSA